MIEKTLPWEDMVKLTKEAIHNMNSVENYLPRQRPSRILEEQNGNLKSNLKSFQDSMVDLLVNDSVNRKGTQFILKGMPSSGKSTELRRLASTLAGHLQGRSIQLRTLVHLSSIQNFKTKGATIHSADQLWRLLLECHESPEITRHNLSLAEFAKIHRERGVSPILLIDTLDLLAYGSGPEVMEIVGMAWNDLLFQLMEHEITVLWSVRPVEFNEIKHSIPDEYDRAPFSEIELPDIIFSEARKMLVNRGQNDLNQADLGVFTALVMLFPILCRFLLEGGNADKQVMRRVKDTILASVTKLRSAEAYGSAHPLVWVIDQLDGHLPTDWIYTIVMEEILEETMDEYQLSDEDEALVIERFEQVIERGFFEMADQRNHTFSNRLVLGLEKDDLHPQIEYMIQLGIDLGLFEVNERSSQLHFTHQLFAEYAVHIEGKRRLAFYGESRVPQVRHLLNSIPSSKLREKENPNQWVNEDYNNQYMRWFMPFFAINKDLRNMAPDDIRHINSKPWQEALSWAKKAERASQKSPPRSADPSSTERDMEHTTSADKEQILLMHRGSKGPLFINGPAGTGKSYLGVPFITQQVERKSDLLSQMTDTKVAASFLSLSDRLSDSFEKEFDKKMKGTNIPVVLNAHSLDSLLQNLEMSLRNDERLHRSWYEGKLLTEAKFVQRLRGHQKFNSGFSTYSPYNLWSEYTKFVLDQKGNPRTKQDYLTKVRSGGDTNNSVFFHEKNQAKPGSFYEILQSLDWLDTDIHRTRACFAANLYDEIVSQLMSDSSETVDLCNERIAPFRSDILVIDEVQDLSSPVLALALLLHRGEPADIAIMGDDEQTLDLVEFDWNQIKREVGSKLRQTSSDDLPKVRSLEPWQHLNLTRLIDGRYHLEEVQRNIPVIVEFIKCSWDTSISEEHLKNRSDKGTSGIRAGEISKARLTNRKKGERRNIEWGVFWLPEESGSVSESSFLSLCEDISRSEIPVAVILPNESLQQTWQKKLDQKEIELVLWDPITIKGLEYSTVLAVSPWSIERTKLASVGDWDSYIEYVSSKTDGFTKVNKTFTEFERFGFQRRRHANVMISRPKHTLFIMHMDFPDLVSAEAPKSSNFTPLGHIDGLRNRIRDVERNEQYDGSLEGILSDIIESNREWGIISRQSAQILKQKFSNWKVPVSEFIQFKILNDFCKQANESQIEYLGMRYLEILLFHKSFRGLLEPGSSREEVYQRFLRPYQNRFAEIASSFEFKDNKRVGAERKVVAWYSPELVPQLISAYNELLEALTIGLNTSYNEYKHPIDKFISSNIFVGTLNSGSSSLWLENAKNLDLKEGKLSTQIEDVWPFGPVAQLVKIISLFHESSYLMYDEKNGKKKTNMKNDILHTVRGYDKNINPRKFDTRYHSPYSVKFNEKSNENKYLNQDFWERGKYFIQTGAFTPSELEELWDVIEEQKDWNIDTEVQLGVFWELIITSNASKIRSDDQDFQYRDVRNKRIQDLLRAMQRLQSNVPEELTPTILEKKSLNLVLALDGNATIGGNALQPQDIFDYVSTPDGYKSVDVRGLFHSEIFGMNELLAKAKLNLEASSAKVARIYEISGFMNKIDRLPENVSLQHELFAIRVSDQLIQHLNSDYDLMSAIKSRPMEIPTLLDRDQMRLGASLSFKPFTTLERIHKSNFFSKSLLERLKIEENRNARLMLAFHQCAKSLYSSQYKLEDLLDTEIAEGLTLIDTLNGIGATPKEWENFFRSLPDSNDMLEEIDILLWKEDLDKSSNRNRFSKWVDNQLLECRSNGLQIPEKPIETILISADGLRRYCGKLYDSATKSEIADYSMRWSYKNWKEFNSNFNPIYIDRLRKYLATNISNESWLQRHFLALENASQHISKHYYAFGSAPNKSVISIDMGRYLNILRYSLFVRSKLPDHYLWTTKKQLTIINTVFSPKNLVEEAVKVWEQISETETMGSGRGRRFSTAFNQIWANFQEEFSKIGLILPKFGSLFSNDPILKNLHDQLLGRDSKMKITDSKGLIGGLEMILNVWTGCNSRLEILPMITHSDKLSRDGKRTDDRDYQQSKLRFLRNSAVWITPNFTNQQIRDLDLEWI